MLFRSVVMPIELDVVVDIDAGALPFGQHETGDRQPTQVGGVQFREGILPATGQFLERTGVEHRQEFGDGGVQLRDREELPVPQSGVVSQII